MAMGGGIDSDNNNNGNHNQNAISNNANKNFVNMSSGVMRDIEERDDLSDSDEEMTDINHMNQVGQADSF